MKIADYVIKVKDRELIEFMDNVQVILNNGLYETRTVTSIPSWTAEEGESALFYQVTTAGIGDRRLYFYVNSLWCYIGWGAGGALALVDADGDTGITPEFTPDEDVLRFYSFGTYVMAVDTYGLQVNSNYPIVFDGLQGIHYWTYDSADYYMKCYVNGNVRMEM